VEAGKLRKAVLCIFNCDLLWLYEPDALFDLKEHEEELTNLNSTEREEVCKARIGQGTYRKNLIDLWKGCAVTGCNNEDILRASHAKSWRDCCNKERLDPFNGLLLIPNLDVLFDQHLITFKEDLSIKISRRLSEEDQKRLGIGPELRLRKLCPRTEKYLSYHREKFYLKECP
jgi:putative restriction endonuclease